MYSITIMMGRMVEDPELRHTPNDVAVSSFRIAVDRPYKVDGKNTADFFTVIAWRKWAEFVCKYFKKGKPIVVQGHFENRSYDAQDGSKRYTTELIAERISFAGDSSGQNKPPLPEPPPEHGSTAPAYSSGNTGDFEEMPVDDDLPF
ncbi:single-stranded DNA-binding protein [Clostridium sp. KNHs216]|uniref:single-stranded DNA-binding protein n=1 Tax=Clostridium sp. KNHs216 TaxID=1550235 RepID=UPI001151957C|nr:single-stranded DNA-binding protein [Clostridium sp. KNHs216]TQI66751.1 single-strand DNA-binding protein [Clostridium sp. KNHs216]